MAFPRKLLGPREEIVLEAHPNWSILVPRVTLVVLILAGCLGVVFAWSHAPVWVGYGLAVIALIFLVALLAKVVTWRSTTLVLTNQRVVYRTGALRRLGREIPLDRVQDVTYTQSILERLVGAGSLVVESAGARGEEPFPDIRHPEMVQSLINRLISGGGPNAGPGGGLSGYQAPAQYSQQYQSPPQSQYQPPQQYQPAPQSQPPPQTQQYDAYRAAEHEPYQSGSSPAPGVPALTSDACGEPASSQSDQLQRLAELLRLGVITDAEYEQKRREIVGRP